MMDKIIMLLLAACNVWLAANFIKELRRDSSSNTDDNNDSKSINKFEDDDGLVGKSRFKMQSRVPQTATKVPQAATPLEIEPNGNIAITFADGNENSSSARVPQDKIEDAFVDIRMSEVPQEYDEDEEEPTEDYATGATFEDMGEAYNVANNPNATQAQKHRAANIFSEIEGTELFNRFMGVSPEMKQKILRVMMHRLEPILDKQESITPQKEFKYAETMDDFNIRDLV